MKIKLQQIIKNTIIWILCVISVFTSIYHFIPVAHSRDEIMNTQAALNSPILNDNAVTDDWNKWEMICWGVFLSNFCQPLIDNYESAFTYNSGRAESSNGTGLNALQFGTGRDPKNNEVIQGFCDYAIKVEKETPCQPIYVQFTNMEGLTIDRLRDQPDPGSLRQATVADIFFKEADWAGYSNCLDAGESKVDFGLTVEIDFGLQKVDKDTAFKNYANNMYMVDSATIPVFYIEHNGRYITILDYTDSYDVQAMSVILNGVRTSKSDSNYTKYFADKLKKYTKEKAVIGLDVFGNIVVNSDHAMVFPACNNQHLTETPQINTLTSWFLNPAISTADETTIIEELQCADNESWIVKAAISLVSSSGYSATGVNGLPPFIGIGKLKSIAGFYYDTDVIAGQMYSCQGKSSLDYGDILRDLFECDIALGSKNKYPICYSSSVNLEKGILDTYFADGDYDRITTLGCLATCVAMSNGHGGNSNKPDILSEIKTPDGRSIPIFSETPICVGIQFQRASNSNNKGEKKRILISRYLYNWMFQVYTGRIKNNGTGSITKTAIEKILEASYSPKSLHDFMASSDSLKTSFKATYDKKIDYKGSDWDKDDKMGCSTSRAIVFYPTSDMARTISQILAVEDGQEFAIYSPYIYMTYLDWYGVINRSTMTTGTQQESKFNKDIFDESNDVLLVDPTTITTAYKSEEEKKSEMIDMGYMMLHPEKGREYRKKMIYNGISDFIYEQYNRLVYGGKDAVYGGTASKASSGFLSVPTYNENMFTSFLIKGYEKIIVVLMGIIVLLLIIFGILKSRRLSWFVISIFMVVNVLLILPSLGEITPYVVTNLTNRLFSKNMTFWEVSEGIANSQLEQQAMTSTGALEGFSDEETQTILRMVNQLSVVYTDRSLMFKQDISQKVTQQLSGIYTNIQTIQSARWMLPVIMQQFSADAKADSEKYIYVKLSNVWDDASNIYWYYNPDEALYVTKPTLTSKQFAGTASTVTTNSETNDATGTVSGNYAYTIKEQEGDSKGSYSYSNLSNYYADYEMPTLINHNNGTNINYKCWSYTIERYTGNNHRNDIHTYFWILHRPGIKTIPTANVSSVLGTPYTTFDDYWGTYIENAKNTLGGSESNWETDAEGNWESMCQDYDRANASTMADGYGYYRTTESPFYYFFCVTKDTFKNDRSYGAIIGQLQGQMKTNSAEDTKEVRTNFMYATDTGGNPEEFDGYSVSNENVQYLEYTRDILDLEFMFKNTIPYLYEMSIISGGWDGTSGILGDKKITDASRYYQGTNQSWVYRCNWAIKLMENPDFSEPQVIYLKDGTKKTVLNPMLPKCYNAVGRNMVFSEAQMIDEGLTEECLSLVELKCIAVNKAVAKNWTLLINYAGTGGMTKEILYRTMATSATEQFCREFSTTGITDNSYAIYPQSTDLRHLSFDAIMRMLLINATKNTTYAYGSSVANVLESESLASALLLLLDALFGAFLINFLQSVILAEILILAAYSMARSLLSGTAYKVKIAGATLIQNLMFMIYTIAYYAFVGLFMSTSSDEVLKASTIDTSSGSPFFTLLLFLILSIAYTLALGKHIVWLFKNCEDMGAEKIGFALSTIGQILNDKIDAAGSGIQNFFSNTFENENSNSTGNVQSIKGTGVESEGTQDVNIKEVDGGSVNLKINNEDTYIESSLADDNAAYYYEEVNVRVSSSDTTSLDIDAEILTGSEMRDED